MRTGKIFLFGLAILGLLASPELLMAKHDDEPQEALRYTLEFIPTQNARPGVQGTMNIRTRNGDTVVHFKLRGGYPNTVYTIWIVYNLLDWPLPPSGTSVPSVTATPITRPGFPPEGNGVAPLARLDRPFTDGMRLDQGATFLTDGNGNGEVSVKVDYDLVWASPVGNKDIIGQCAPFGLVPVVNSDGTITLACSKDTSPRSMTVRVTTTWLRRYIGEFPLAERASKCANYNPNFDPDTGVTPPLAGLDSRYWQCVDPSTLKNPDDPWSGLPRVHRFQFDHFRLATHPDSLTHGLIGGSGVDHFIDMVGRRCDLMPSVVPPGQECP